MNARLRAFSVLAALALVGCGSSDNGPAEPTIYGSCAYLHVADPVGDGGCPDGPTFESLQPILARSCLPACHDDSPDAAWPLTDYEDVRDWKLFVSQDLLQCAMPPIGSGYPITRADRETILGWISCGTPK
jgi:hypothetical protein